MEVMCKGSQLIVGSIDCDQVSQSDTIDDEEGKKDNIQDSGRNSVLMESADENDNEDVLSRTIFQLRIKEI